MIIKPVTKTEVKLENSEMVLLESTIEILQRLKNACKDLHATTITSRESETMNANCLLSVIEILDFVENISTIEDGLAE